MTTANDVCRKYSAGVTAAPTAKGVPAWLSVPVVDRSGDFIDGSDMDLSQYLLNPVVLWCHKIADPPIGRFPDLAAKGYGNGFDGLFGHVEFDAGDEFACRVRDKYESGYLRGLSVGFVPSGGWRDLTAGERAKVGCKTRARRMLKGKLLEASCVPVPDNQLALAVVMKTFGASIPDELKAVITGLTPDQTTFAADLTKVSGKSKAKAGGRFPGPNPQFPADTQGTAKMADQTKPAAADAADHDVTLGDESAVLFKAVGDVDAKIVEQATAAAEFKTAIVKALEEGFGAILEKQAELAAELAEMKAFNAKAEEFAGEQAKAIAGLYERKGR
jgi:hypothetical protein